MNESLVILALAAPASVSNDVSFSACYERRIFRSRAGVPAYLADLLNDAEEQLGSADSEVVAFAGSLQRECSAAITAVERHLHGNDRLGSAAESLSQALSARAAAIRNLRKIEATVGKFLTNEVAR